MRTLNRSILALLLLGSVLTAAPSAAQDDSDMAGRIITWQTEYNADNIDALVAMYTSDGCRMPPNMDAVYGSDAIREHFLAGKEAGWAQVELGFTTGATSGDMGWGQGTYIIMDADGEEIDNGKWINVSKKVDGMWKIHCDIWNSNVPLEIME